MDAELSEIKPLRKRLGLTQHQLAAAAGVSQSLVAKVETGLVDPSFSSGKQMLAALRSFERGQEPDAAALMERHVVVVKAEDKLTAAIRKMQTKAISQLPVLDGTNVAGLLTERCIVRSMDAISHDTTIVADVMEEAPPVVTPEAPRKVLAGLLSHYTLVLVKEKGKIKGIITKADLLKSV